MKQFDYAVVIGRFQPIHKGHVHMIEEAKKVADKVLVLVGSKTGPRTIKNPFNFLERETLIKAKFPDVIVDGVDDYLYNDNYWVAQVQDKIKQCTKGSVVIVGHNKDESTYYLNLFPEYKVVSINAYARLDATRVRTAMFENNLQFVEDELVNDYEKDFIWGFMQTPEFKRLQREHIQIRDYKRAWESAPYPPTFVTVDAVVVQSGHILLVQRKASPGEGLWALPGGFVNQKEKLLDAMIRELREETKLKVPDPVLRGSIKRQRTYDHPERSLRGRTITHAYNIALAPGALPKVKGCDDAMDAKWFPISDFLQMREVLFEDHWFIVTDLLGIC